MQLTKLLRWQSITLGTLFVGYAGYYICRSNLSIAVPLILNEFEDQGITRADLGRVASVGVLFYAIGKITNGITTDFLGGRFLFLFGMFASVLCTILFGLSGGIPAFIFIWAANRYVQSMGWGALIKISSRWFPFFLHATIMGILSTSFLVGDAFARLYLGTFIRFGLSWREIFFVSAGSLLGIAALGWFTLKNSPKDVHCDEPRANPDNAYGKVEGEESTASSFWDLMIPLAMSPGFWLICSLNFGLTLIRESFNFWSPTYLTEVAELDPGVAAQASLVFPLTGALSAILAGVGADVVRHRLGLIILPSVLFLTGILWSVQFIPVQGNAYLAIAMLSCVAFFLLAPYSYLSGVAALIIGGKKGASTVAGFSDSFGYLGAFLSGEFMGRIADQYGWSAVLNTLAMVAGVSTIIATVYFLSELPYFATSKTHLPEIETKHE